MMKILIVTSKFGCKVTHFLLLMQIKTIKKHHSLHNQPTFVQLF
jgi:hypothetical protein